MCHFLTIFVKILIIRLIELFRDPWPQLPTIRFKSMLYNGNNKVLQYLQASAKLPELKIRTLSKSDVNFFFQNNGFQPLNICKKCYVRCLGRFQNPAPTPPFLQFECNRKNSNLAGLINLRVVITFYILTQDAIQ